MLAALALPGAALAFGPLASFGEFGSGPGQLSSPRQAAVDAAGDVYVADAGNDRIAVFAGDGTFLRTFGEDLQEPADIALDEDGRAFVADSGNGRIAVFPTADTPFFIGQGALGEPSGVAVDGSTVYVADSGENSIDVFDDGGEFLRSFGSATLAAPRDVIVGPDGDLYVADYDNGEVDVYAKDGDLRDSFGDAVPGDLGPVALASDGASEIYVADQLAQRVERFLLDGTHLGGFAAEPEVAGVALACQGNVFTVSAQLARVTRFGEPDTPPPPCAAAPQVAPVAPVAKPPSNRLRFAGLRRNRRNGSAVLFVRVAGPGKVFLWGRGVRRVRRGTQRAKRVRLPVRPKIPLKRFLKRRGKAAIRVNVGFQPVAGIPRTFEKRIVLKRKRARRYR
jgi:sugar lactone lactonase YvrE